MNYRIAKQLYKAGLYDVVVRLAASKDAHLRMLPFKEGQPLKIQVKGETVVGQYVGTIRDSFLLSVSGHPVSIPFNDVTQICVFWH